MRPRPTRAGRDLGWGKMKAGWQTAQLAAVLVIAGGSLAQAEAPDRDTATALGVALDQPCRITQPEDAAPAFSAALAASGLALDWTATCGEAMPVLGTRFESDPANTDDAAQTVALMRVFMAGGMTPVALADADRGVVVVLEPGEGGMQTRLVSLRAAGSDTPEPASDLPVAQEALLQGAGDARWLPYESYGGSFTEFASWDGTTFRVQIPEGRNWGKTGLKSAEPLIPALPPDAPVLYRLGFRIDMQSTVKAVLSLLPDTEIDSDEWAGHDIRIAREIVPGKGHMLVVWVRGEERGRLFLDGPDDLTEFALLVDPRGTAMVTDTAGRVLVDTPLPDRMPDTGWHLVAMSEGIEKNGASGMVLESATLERLPRRPAGDPQALAREAARTDILFEGGKLGPALVPWRVGGGDFAAHARFETGALLVDVPEGSREGIVGLAAPEPVIWLDRLEPDGRATLRLTFDAARTTGFGIALVPYLVTDGNFPNPPSVMLDWVALAGGGTRARAWTDRNAPVFDLDPGAMPDRIEIEMTPGGFRVLADGVPADFIEWPRFAEGHGLRLVVYSQPEEVNRPVTMALKQIALTRTPSPVPRPLHQPAPGVDPLAQEVLFNGLPHGAFEPIGIGGAAFDQFARYENGALHVDVPKKYQWSRTGLLSSDPVAVLDERVHLAPYRLRLHFDPVETDNFRVILSPRKEADMWEHRTLEATLVRETEGRRKGQYRMTLGKGYYDYWTRWIDPDTLAGQWDGGVELLIGHEQAEFALDGVARLGAHGFVTRPGNSLYMTVTTLSARPYGPARMVLDRIEGGWAPPPAMNAATRARMVDDEAFDPEAFLDLIGEDLTEDLP